MEGGHAKDAINYLVGFLSSRVDSTCPDSLIEELRGTLSFQADKNTNTTMGRQVHDTFQENKPLLIAGGWTGEPSGHAIYYEIIPVSDSQANFRLYNTGAGIAAHHQAIEGHKIKYQSYCEWKGISCQKLESPHFFEALRELSLQLDIPNSNEPTEYKEADIY